MLGTFFGHVGDIVGICLGHVWDMIGTFVGHLCDIWEICLGHAFDIVGTFLGRLWGMLRDLFVWRGGILTPDRPPRAAYYVNQC